MSVINKRISLFKCVRGSHIVVLNDAFITKTLNEEKLGVFKLGFLIESP